MRFVHTVHTLGSYWSGMKESDFTLSLTVLRSAEEEGRKVP